MSVSQYPHVEQNHVGSELRSLGGSGATNGKAPQLAGFTETKTIVLESKIDFSTGLEGLVTLAPSETHNSAIIANFFIC